MEDTPTAGIDWSWQRHAVCVVDGHGVRLGEFDVTHTARGLAALVHRLEVAAVRRVGIERGDGPLVDYLLASGFEVFVISPRQVKALRLRYRQAGNKDDRFDAFVLADVVRTDRHRLEPLRLDQPDTVALRMLVRARKDLVNHRIAVHNQLLASLQQVFPGAVGLFSQLDRPISLRFMTRFPTASKAQWLSERRLENWLKANSYCGRKTPAELMAHLDNAAPCGLTGATIDASEVIVTTQVRLLSELRDRIDDIETRIREALLAHPDAEIFMSLPRAGIIRAATLLGEIGDCRSRYPDEASLAAAAGVAPSTRQSGSFHHVTYRRACDKPLRAAIVDWAQDTPRANPWAADVYQRARQRGCRHPHATRILARAWIRILWRCWQDHMPYDPAKHRSHQLATQAA